MSFTVKISRPAEEELYRVRVGDCRIVYQIQDNQLIVLIVQVGHRREIYR
jgi:mRNA interferase RelE/StbE